MLQEYLACKRSPVVKTIKLCYPPVTLMGFLNFSWLARVPSFGSSFLSTSLFLLIPQNLTHLAFLSRKDSPLPAPLLFLQSFLQFAHLRRSLNSTSQQFWLTASLAYSNWLHFDLFWWVAPFTYSDWMFSASPLANKRALLQSKSFSHLWIAKTRRVKKWFVPPVNLGSPEPPGPHL